MAKTSQPLLSGRVYGQIGKTLVYDRQRGVDYVRRYVVPRDPKTAAQLTQRSAFRLCQGAWRNMGPIAQEPWLAATRRSKRTGRNHMSAINMPILVQAGNTRDWQASPGALGGLAPLAVVVFGTFPPGALEVDVFCPPEPYGWTLEKIQLIAFAEQSPAFPWGTVIHEQEDTNPAPGGTTVMMVTGLPNILHVVSAWTVWSLPRGVTAYGLSRTETGTPF